ncbi:inositol monophosphatase family protein [Gracilinema caldarium]|uniref:Inositol-1-monophosphatase n=1 Tax=Gracilinema caldarium (strain ATCC 51460 / DSM 7334 / H1) TaxID=744872 RepID=F8EWX6_GRAC1|nr:inositol monophosphatase family protein [Gracilinema caldarium]AEJ18362.1 inositol monophosphatase [Gracilinema caldarium DSM 7334]
MNTSLLQAMVVAAKAAGSFQMSEFRCRGPGWGDTKAAHDFVSFVDVESEQHIKTILHKTLPEAAFYGEETEKERGTEYTWIVDPLDGTTNYLSGLDHFSVSIALWQQDHPVLAVVYKPSTEELFTAIANTGAWRNGIPLTKAQFMDPIGALIATGTPYRSPDTVPAFYRALDQVLQTFRDVRRCGSAALDLCYVAAGFFQGFWEVDLQPYDVAAGLLLLQETGNLFTNFQGRPYDPFIHRGLVTGRPGVYELLAQQIKIAYGTLT